SDLPRRQIEVVVNDDEVFYIELKVIYHRPNSHPRTVHVGLRLQQDDFFPADATFPYMGIPFASVDGNAPLFTQSVNDAKSDVVARPSVWGPWISQADNQLHESSPQPHLTRTRSFRRLPISSGKGKRIS